MLRIRLGRRVRFDWRRSIPIIVISAAIAVFAIPGWAGAEAITFVSPGEGVEATTSKPPIVCEVGIPVSQQNMLAQLDGIDITGALDFTPTGFEFKPVQPLMNGPHQLYLVVYCADGSVVEQVFSFSTFTKMSSNTQVSAVYEQVLDKSDHLTQIPHRNFAANLGNTTTFTQGAWQMGLTTNLRWLDRSMPMYAPEKKGIDLVNYLITAQYLKDDLSLQLNAGDLQIQETQNTVMGLARRGVQTNFNYKKLSLSGFVVNSEQMFGIDDGTGLEFDTSDNIKGVSGGYSLLSDTLKLRAIYVTGAEESNSFGIYDADSGQREGDVLGLLVQYQLLEGKLNLEAEYDWSDFDANTDDEFSAETGKAWTLRASGYAGSYNYQAVYEYVGPEYEVIGNPGLQRDREGFTVMGGVQKAMHGLNLSASRYEDNVDEDERLPQVVATMVSADYSFNRFPTLPMGLNYQKMIMDSSMIPEGGLPYRTDTDMYGARINYMAGPWNFGFNANYSTQNDKTESNYDTKNQTYSFSPTYYAETLSLSPNLSFNRSTDETSGIDTDTLTVTLDLRGTLYQGSVSYEFGGAFNQMKNSDDTMEMDMVNGNARVAYHFLQEWAGFLNPSVGIRGLYNRTNDKVFDQDDDEFALLLVLSTSMGFAF